MCGEVGVWCVVVWWWWGCRYVDVGSDVSFFVWWLAGVRSSLLIYISYIYYNNNVDLIWIIQIYFVYLYYRRGCNL